MKQPLVVMNGPYEARAAELLVSRATGEFMRELTRQIPRASMYQYSLAGREAALAGCQNFFPLGELKGVDTHSQPYHPTRRLQAQLDRLAAYSGLVQHVARASAVYAFLPGRLPESACRLASLLGRPFGVYVRGPLNPQHEGTRSLLAKAGLLTCNNLHTLNELEAAGLKPRLIRPMIDVTRADLATEPRSAMPAKPRLLFVGRVEVQKGIPELYQALLLLKEKSLDFDVKLAGAGQLCDRDKIPPQLRDTVQLLGPVDGKERLSALYREADLFAFPSHFESFPRVLYEAMTHGLPIATTFVNGIPALMRDGRNSLHVEPHDPHSLATALERIAREAGLAETLSAGALDTMREFFARNLPWHHSLATDWLKGLPA